MGGGEFYTPTAIVRLMVEILEPFEGRVLDPACGSGGMFVQSARFVAEHKKAGALSIHGIEKVDDTGKLCRLNLAVHGLEGDIRTAARSTATTTTRTTSSVASTSCSRIRRSTSTTSTRTGSATRWARAPLSVRRTEARQRELPLDPDLLRGAQRQGPRRLRDGELGVRRARVGAGVAPATHRGPRC
jgi:hypothetical protein